MQSQQDFGPTLHYRSATNLPAWKTRSETEPEPSENLWNQPTGFASSSIPLSNKTCRKKSRSVLAIHQKRLQK
jgi:hypothetical protein